MAYILAKTGTALKKINPIHQTINFEPKSMKSLP